GRGHSGRPPRVEGGPEEARSGRASSHQPREKGIPRPTPRTTGDRHLSEPDRDSRRRRRGPPGAAGRALGPSLEALSPLPVSGSPLPRVVIDPFRNGLRVEVDPVEDDPPPPHSSELHP